MSPQSGKLGWRGRVRAYQEVASVNARTVMAYRADYLFGLLTMLMQIYLLRLVWTSAYGDRDAVDGVHRSAMLAYATLASVQYWLLNPWRLSAIPERVRDGKIAVDLVRPIRLVGQAVAGQAGAVAAMVPFVVLALPFALLTGGVDRPPSPGAFAGYVVSVLLAAVVTILLGTAMGLVAFWTLEVTGVYLVYRMVAQFMSGALVPLWFMPDWLRTVCGVLPFQATSYTPVAIYVGELTGTAALRAVVVQMVWIGALWGLVRLVWWRAFRRAVVQGG